jgi:hypothetical protein
MNNPDCCFVRTPTNAAAEWDEGFPEHTTFSPPLRWYVRHDFDPLKQETSMQPIAVIQ